MNRPQSFIFKLQTQTFNVTKQNKHPWEKIMKVLRLTVSVLSTLRRSWLLNGPWVKCLNDFMSLTYGKGTLGCGNKSKTYLISNRNIFHPVLFHCYLYLLIKASWYFGSRHYLGQLKTTKPKFFFTLAKFFSARFRPTQTKNVIEVLTI